MKMSTKSKTLRYLALVLGMLLIALPLYMCIVTTFKPTAENAASYFSLPSSLYLGNYAQILSSPKLYYAYANTIFITALSLAGSVLLMPMMSFAISRAMPDSRFFRVLYVFLLLGIFIPFQVRMVPLVRILSSLHLLNQAGIIIVYVAHATCESVFLYVGYLATIDKAIEEAAYIDGATTFQTFRKVIFPLMRPIIVTVMIREGLAIWNDYLLPLVTLNKSWQMQTLTLFQYNFQGEFSVDYSLAFTSFVISCLPIVIFYIIMQKQIIGGLTSGAVKG